MQALQVMQWKKSTPKPRPRLGWKESGSVCVNNERVRRVCRDSSCPTRRWSTENQLPAADNQPADVAEGAVVDVVGGVVVEEVADITVVGGQLQQDRASR